ncbi:MAG: hypothetical protein KAT71_02865 [Gammaproteobacteria bacterium]|nr:hypothetical protein [Gammaproteobacteria bacterium]
MMKLLDIRQALGEYEDGKIIPKIFNLFNRIIDHPFINHLQEYCRLRSQQADNDQLTQNDIAELWGIIFNNNADIESNALELRCFLRVLSLMICNGHAVGIGQAVFAMLGRCNILTEQIQGSIGVGNRNIDNLMLVFALLYNSNIFNDANFLAIINNTRHDAMYLECVVNGLMPFFSHQMPITQMAFDILSDRNCYDNVSAVGRALRDLITEKIDTLDAIKAIRINNGAQALIVKNIIHCLKEWGILIPANLQKLYTSDEYIRQIIDIFESIGRVGESLDQEKFDIIFNDLPAFAFEIDRLQRRQSFALEGLRTIYKLRNIFVLLKEKGLLDFGKIGIVYENPDKIDHIFSAICLLNKYDGLLNADVLNALFSRLEHINSYIEAFKILEVGRVNGSILLNQDSLREIFSYDGGNATEIADSYCLSKTTQAIAFYLSAIEMDNGDENTITHQPQEEPPASYKPTGLGRYPGHFHKPTVPQLRTQTSKTGLLRYPIKSNLYSAIALCLGQDVSALRKTIADNITRNKEEYRALISLPTNQTIDDYIRDIRDTTTLVRELELPILMRLLDRPIVIMELDNGIRQFDVVRRYAGIGGAPIFVQSNGLASYDALMLDDDADDREILSRLIAEMRAKHHLNEASAPVTSFNP